MKHIVNEFLQDDIKVLAKAMRRWLRSGSSIPLQTGHIGEFLTTDGSSPSWTAASPGGGVALVTYAELVALINTSGLTAGTLYKITDRGDRGLFFQAISTNQLAKDGTRLMLCPTFYGTGANGGNTWIGVWNSTKSVNVDELTIWGGLVWKNLTGAIGTADSDILLDAVNWAVVPKASFGNGEYIELIFCVNYDIVNDWIEKQWDGSGNVFGIDYFTEIDDWEFGFNLCDVSDWNYASSGRYFFDNKAMGVFNNSCFSIYSNICGVNIYNNTNSGNIGQNKCSGFIGNNSNSGAINGNVSGNIQNNSNGSDIANNFTPEGVSNNSNTGLINGNSNTFINSNGSSVTNIINNRSTQDISGNNNIGEVSNNGNDGFIRSNTNGGSIYYNSNLGEISGNTNDGEIEKNWNAGEINENSNDGDISFNGNLWYINSNSNKGDIAHNNNNGSIFGNSSGTDPCNISNNTNNGNIANGTFSADVTDPIVNK